MRFCASRWSLFIANAVLATIVVVIGVLDAVVVVVVDDAGVVVDVDVDPAADGGDTVVPSFASASLLSSSSFITPDRN